MRSSGLRPGWIFGPNLDDCYFYRLRFNDTSELLESGKESRQSLFAIKQGVPRLEDIPIIERQALFTANFEGRNSGITISKQILCIKHFPGGDRLLENTEHISKALVYSQSMKEWKWRLQPFVDLIQSPIQLSALMTSHACYPGLEESLRSQHPEIRSWMEADMDVPATFSPYILRGLLRKDLGYRGVVVSDWVDMGTINRFLLDYRKRLPLRYKQLSDHALVSVLAIEAGCHFITGTQNRILRDSRSKNIEPVITELAAFEASSPGWEETVSGRFKEALDWFRSNKILRADTIHQRAYNIPFRDKLRLMLGEEIRSGRAAGLNHFSTKGFQDLWNRQGLLHKQLRAFYIEPAYGVKSLELPYRSDDERVVSRNRNIEWLETLSKTQEYMKHETAIDWTSDESRRAWNKALVRFREERSRQ
jgi:glycosyl hydrolase family 3